MKVCFLARLTNNASMMGGDGVERYAFNLYEELIKKGIKVKFPYPKWTEYFSEPFRSISGLLAFDILSLPFVFRNKEIDIYHAVFPQQGFYSSLLKKRNFVITAHHIDDLNDYPGTLRQISFQTFFDSAFSIATRNSKHIIAVSTQTKQELISKFKINNEKITVIHSGVNERFQPLEKKTNGTRIIGYIGSLTKRKRVNYLIHVFDILKKNYPKIKCQLEIYGVGPEYRRLSRYGSKLKDVFFKGFVLEEKIVEIYNSFDVFVFPSQHEGFGLPILEAQRCGIPVLVDGKSKIPYEIKKKTVQCLDKEDMANKIYLILKDKKFRQKISKQGLEYSKKFTWEKCAQQTIEVYNNVVGN